ncbi:MAG: HPr(Ser) kinase/phosphatase [Pseudomonadota bacterium]
MAPPLTVETILQRAGNRLDLRWLGGGGDTRRAIDRVRDEASVVGHFNPVRPPAIQILGEVELEYLENLSGDALEHALASLLLPDGLVIVSGDHSVPDWLLERATTAGIPVLASPSRARTVITHLRHGLADLVAKQTTLHGVFLEVLGLGILLTGSSAIGKSELALELISRGHRFIADDAPQFRRLDPQTINGRCPELLEGFLEVRGLGILDIPAMFGESAIKSNKNLRLVIHLAPIDQITFDSEARLHGAHDHLDLLGVEVPTLSLPVAPGRNLAVLVEGAVRNHILRQNGYNAADTFIQRQRNWLAERHNGETP